MAQISVTYGIATGVSADGQIRYASCNSGPTIDGSRAIRGYYCNAQGGMDLTRPVGADTWQSAVALMQYVDEALEQRRTEGRAAEERRQAALDEREARVASVRGGPLDPNTF